MQQRAATEAVSDKDEEDVVNMRPMEAESHPQTDSDIEAKLATVKDQKEAKRLKRSALTFHNPFSLLLQPCKITFETPRTIHVLD